LRGDERVGLKCGAAIVFIDVMRDRPLSEAQIETGRSASLVEALVGEFDRADVVTAAGS